MRGPVLHKEEIPTLSFEAITQPSAQQRFMRTGRGYQLACIEAVRDAFKRGVKGCVIEIPTGGGKGFIIASIAKMVRDKGNKCLILVNRDNLVNQLHDSACE